MIAVGEASEQFDYPIKNEDIGRAQLLLGLDALMAMSTTRWPRQTGSGTCPLVNYWGGSFNTNQ